MSPAAGSQILIVEDEAHIRRFVRLTLEAEGHTVHEADGYQRGLIEAGTRRPDLVVLDPKAEKVISASAQQSAIDYNVFEGQKVKGLPRFVLTRGQIAIDDGAVKTQEGHGQFVGREARRPGPLNRCFDTLDASMGRRSG